MVGTPSDRRAMMSGFLSMAVTVWPNWARPTEVTRPAYPVPKMPSLILLTYTLRRDAIWWGKSPEPIWIGRASAPMDIAEPRACKPPMAPLSNDRAPPDGVAGGACVSGVAGVAGVAGAAGVPGVSGRP